MRNGYGTSQLAGALREAMRELAGNTLWLELGTIQPDLSLLPDKFSVPIPPSDYLVSRWLSGYSGMAVSASGSDQHTHVVTTQRLQPGDRVLIAWVHGSDPVILDVVVSGDA